jgi:hypothetical protein
MQAYRLLKSGVAPTNVSSELAVEKMNILFTTGNGFDDCQALAGHL